MKKFILSIALPSALQGMITVAMSFIDSLMLGSLTESSIAAASLASQPVFVFTVVHFGLSGGSSVLTAQFWGSKDVESLKKTMGLMYRISAVISMGFFGVCQLPGARILGVMSSDPEVQALGLIYLHTVSWGFLFQGVTLCTMAVLRSVRTVRIAVVTSMGACVFNVVGNYLLIYGHGGFPALGVRGAAIATMAARVAECLIGVGYLLVFEKKIRFRISDLWKSSREIRKKFLENSALVIANESIWSLGMSLFMVIIGQLGTAAVTAYSVSQVLIQLAETFVSGIGYAAGVMSGNLIGAGKRQEAQRSAEQFIRISVLLGIGVGLLVRPVPLSCCVPDIGRDKTTGRPDFEDSGGAVIFPDDLLCQYDGNPSGRRRYPVCVVYGYFIFVVCVFAFWVFIWNQASGAGVAGGFSAQVRRCV